MAVDGYDVRGNPLTRLYREKRTILQTVLFIAFVAWSLYNALFSIETYLFRMGHLVFIFMLTISTHPFLKQKRRWIPWLDAGLTILALVALTYALLDVDQYIRRSTLPNPLDIVFGIIATVILIDLARRVIGRTFAILLVIFILYALFGNYIPGLFTNKGYSIGRLIGILYMTLDGIYGSPLAVSASYMLLFILYGAFMDAAGAGRFWLDLSMVVMGQQSSSAGRGALLTTALLGGPQASGVATTMSVTPIMWPMLKKVGYSPDKAAGLISAGGIGAIISPPLMGAVAFLIMQFLHKTFWEVVVMVTVPTLLYYLGLFFMVEWDARKYRYPPPSGVDGISLKSLLARSYHLFSLIVLVALFAMGRSPEFSVIWALLTVIITSFLSRDRKEWLVPSRIVTAVVEGGKSAIPVAALLASAGIIVGVFSLTGLGLKISQLIMSFSDGYAPVALVLALATSLLVGLSLPITATYIMTVVMIVPALIKVGIPDQVAHLAVFYFAVLSEVSPPVGLSPTAAAVITGGRPFRSMLYAWKYSLPAFCIPFLFSASSVGTNLLLLGASPPQFLLALITAVVVLFWLSLSVTGYYIGPLNFLERVMLISLSAWICVNPLNISIVGLLPGAMGVMILMFHVWRYRQDAKRILIQDL